MYLYTAYGLGIYSEFQLPELVLAEDAGDVFIRQGKFHANQLQASNGLPFLEINPKEATFSHDLIGTFLIKDGRDIVVSPVLGVDMRLIQRYLVGTIMAILLYQRGLLVLHASSVNINGKSIAFLGEVGSGKSSLAAALQRRGHELISDDISPVDLTSDPPIIFPGYPQIKLSSEAAKAISCEFERLIILGDWETKRGYRLENGFVRSSSVLHRIYVLHRGSNLNIKPLEAQETVKELIRHSFPTRLLQPGSAEHFLKCIQLANQIPIYRLERTSSIGMLPQLAAYIEDHVFGEVLA